MDSKRSPHGEKLTGALAHNNQKTGRGKGRPFKPGASANPGGRPKLTQEQRDAAVLMKALTPAAVVQLAVLGGLTDREPAKSEMVQFLCLKAIADKGLPNAPQESRITGKDGEPLKPPLTLNVPSIDPQEVLAILRGAGVADRVAQPPCSI